MEGLFVKLRPLNYSDCEQIRTWRNSRDVYYNMYNWDYITPEMQEVWYRNKVQGNETNKFFLISTKTDIPIGLISLNDIDYKNRKSSFAYYIANPKDRMPTRSVDAERLILDYAFNDLNLNKICCEVFEYNKAVINFHKKFGFIKEGLFRQHAMHEGKLKDVVYLGLLNEEYYRCRPIVWALLCKVSKH